MKENEPQKRYLIPRKVNQSFKIFKLDFAQLGIIISIFIADVIMIWFTSVPPLLKLVITVLSLSMSYALMTTELGNGLRAIEYVKMKFEYKFSQKEYTMFSSKKLIKNKDELRITHYKMSTVPVKKEPVISDWEDKKLSFTNDQNEKPLEDLIEFIPEPKVLTRQK